MRGYNFPKKLVDTFFECPSLGNLYPLSRLMSPKSVASIWTSEAPSEIQQDTAKRRDLESILYISMVCA